MENTHSSAYYLGFAVAMNNGVTAGPEPELATNPYGVGGVFWRDWEEGYRNGAYYKRHHLVLTPDFAEKIMQTGAVSDNVWR